MSESLCLRRCRRALGATLPVALAWLVSSAAAAQDRAGRRRPDLEVGAERIRYLPSFPRPGDRVGIAITVRNLGAEDARAALIRYGLVGGRHDSTGIDIRGRDSVVIRWRVDLPSAGPWRLEVTAEHPADADSTNNSSIVTLGTAARAPLRAKARR